MSYRLFRITNLYNEYLTQYYAAFPNIKDAPFDVQHDHLTKNSVDNSSSFVRHLRKIGVDAHDTFSNAKLLQDRWKLERGSRAVGKDLALEQIKSVKPDVVWLDDITLIDAGWIAHLKNEVPSIRLVTGHLCAPYYQKDIENLKGLDFLITCTPCLKSEFEYFGIETHLLYHAFDPDILSRIEGENNYPGTTLLFTGSLYLGGAFHTTRIEFIEDILRHGLPLQMYGNADSRKKVFYKKAAYLLGRFIQKTRTQSILNKLPSLGKAAEYGDYPVKGYSQKLRRNLNPPVFGIEQFKLLSRTEVTFNLHGDIAKTCAGNARLFEATGVGSCLLTDWKENLGELFEPEKEVVTYKSREECIEKMKWLMDNPAERKKIAAAGQARTLRDHTFEHRVEIFNKLVLERI